MTTRRERFDEYVEDNLVSIYDMELADPNERFLLVETSKYDGTLYLSTHDSPSDAAAYHDGGEEPEDWPGDRLIDLDTGEVYEGGTEAHYTTAFPKAEEVVEIERLRAKADSS
mgnify:FL=1